MFQTSLFRACLLVCAAQMALASPVYYDKKLQEAEQIALESSGFIVPIDALVRKIMRDLKSIRSEYSEVAGVSHRMKWIPGQVLARGITDNQIEMIEESGVFGPLEKVKKYNFGSVLVFAKAYNPERLSERLMEKFGIRAEPNTSTGDAKTATGVINYNPAKGVYTMEKGPVGYNFPGYSNMYTWTFGVQGGKVTMIDSSHPGGQVVRRS